MTDDLDFDAVSHVGMVRSENQDRFGYWPADDLHDHEDVRLRGRLFVVCDGMGGHNGGSIASATTVEAMLASWPGSKDVPTRRALAMSIDSANAAVRTKASQDNALRNMGTTLVALVVRGPVAHVAHIGDSRCYRMRGGQLEQVTRDHTYLNDLIEIGLLTPEKARNHPERNIITRCVGMGDDLKVDFKPLDVQPGDSYLLCTDGLYNYVDASEITEKLGALPAERACQELIDLANAHGGEDNITCLIVKVKDVDGTVPAEPIEDTVSTTRPITKPVRTQAPAGGTDFPTQQTTTEVLPPPTASVPPKQELTKLVMSAGLTRPIETGRWRKGWMLAIAVQILIILFLLVRLRWNA